ncbi:MAG: adenosylcobinamide-phosphate synthase CbiB [Acidimicrobiales bacterium]
MVSSSSARLFGPAAGLLVDRFVPEPPSTVHPVALFGRVMTAIEKRLWRDSVGAGAVYAALGVIVSAVSGWLVRSTTVATATVVAGPQLRRISGDIANLLEQGDLEGARDQLPALVGRDPAGLDESAISAAVVESLAENTVDAVVAPVCWAVVGGAGGAFVYRALNTMDAMVGNRSVRYHRFGRVSARLDDVVNFVPARVTAVLIAASVPHRWKQVRMAVGRDAASHPSPNAGVAESAMAAALGVELGGRLSYEGRVEQRPCLGVGPRPVHHDIRRAIVVARRTETLLASGLAVVGLLRIRRWTR